MSLRSPSKNNMSALRSILTSKSSIPPDLRHALSILKLTSLDDLEDRLLSTPAFLLPWSVFRDSLLLLAPDCMPTPTLIKGAGSGTSRLDLLWFYTQFDEGSLRYDRRADRYSSEYTPDSSVYGVIDKSNWRVDEYEKHLFAWLLQSLKVGKAYSPMRFTYFELKNICTAWEDVLVPIVNAVRAAYDQRGRRYYGRLALFIEERCPSRLAFPEGNITVPDGGVLSPTPYRVVSAPRKVSARESYAQQDNGNCNGMLSRRHYDETEKELRDVYPQYGGLVERPKFKHKMEEWLAEQRARAARRKEHERKDGEVTSGKPHVVHRSGSRSPVKQLPATPRGSFRSKKDGSESPIKQVADSIKRSFSLTMTSMKAKDETQPQKSPLHGVTRQLQIPDINSVVDDSARSSMVISLLPRPGQVRKQSEASMYTSIRNSNPFTEDFPEGLKAQGRASTAESVHTLPNEWSRARASSNDSSLFSPMGQLSAIPPPLKADAIAVHNYGTSTKNSFRDVRAPSYEGTAYKDEISLTDLHNQRLQAARSPAEKLATRLPAPIVPVPYSGPRVASADKEKDMDTVKSGKDTAKHAKDDNTAAKGNVSSSKLPPSPPKSIPLLLPAKSAPIPAVYKPTTQSKDPISPPKSTAWPGFDSDSESTSSSPPIPAKSPSRNMNTPSRVPGYLRNPRSRTITREHDISRIVSKENIRAALGGLTPKSSAESLSPALPPEVPLGGPVRTMSPRLRPYNSHMFPRREEEEDEGGVARKGEDKGTPVGQWLKTEEAEEQKHREEKYVAGEAF